MTFLLTFFDFSLNLLYRFQTVICSKERSRACVRDCALSQLVPTGKKGLDHASDNSECDRESDGKAALTAE